MEWNLSVNHTTLSGSFLPKETMQFLYVQQMLEGEDEFGNAKMKKETCLVK